MTIHLRLLAIGAVLLTAMLTVSCGGPKPYNTSAPDISPLPCVVLLPSMTHYGESNEDGAAGEVEGRDDLLVEGPGDPGVEGHGDLQAGARFLDEAVREELQASKVDRIVETAQLRLKIEEIAGDGPGAYEAISREADCNAVLALALTRFHQREGGEYAVDSPASAAFELRLIDAQSGKNLWTANFNETQESLMSNIFSFHKARNRGFKWITVEELVSQGVHEKVSECPYFY